ncbi:MAG: hypothetical protein RRZ67_01765 [Victivallaceae bacterium]
MISRNDLFLGIFLSERHIEVLKTNRKPYHPLFINQTAYLFLIHHRQSNFLLKKIDTPCSTKKIFDNHAPHVLSLLAKFFFRETIESLLLIRLDHYMILDFKELFEIDFHSNHLSGAIHDKL